MSKPAASYITTPLYYVNARPHIGHFYTTMLADVVKRHRVQRGRPTTFLTGTDEHGEKIEQIATAQNIDVKKFVDEVAADFQTTWQKLGLDFDIFYRTTDVAHESAVQYALQTLKDRGEIVFREYEGMYCVGCERFLTDNEVTADGACPDHKKKPEPRKEANYFFLMSKYRDQLLAHYEKNPNAIRPENYRNEILSFLKQPLGDLCISRPKERLKWGIELPFDSKFVTYVWFDALMNYLVATGWPGKSALPSSPEWNKELWSSVNHFIAKDILKTHAIYWPAMLMALEAPVFHELHTHGYWLIDGSKMSKSLGKVIRPLEVEEKYGAETLRFYLMREMSFGLDSTFTLEAYVNCINAYLANGIGNLVSRVYTLCVKNFKGTFTEASLTAVDLAALAKRQGMLETWNASFEELKYQNALKAWSELVTSVDLYVNEMKPWALAKDPEQTERLQTVLGVCLRLIQTLGVVIYPVLPKASAAILESLGVSVFGAPDLQLALENRCEYKLGTEVPKLFMRVQLPTATEE